jgi:hypothetical protein
MAETSITVTNTWYCAYTASNEWVSSIYKNNKYIYCGYADWHTGEGEFNWRACVEITTPTDFKSAYKVNSFTFAVSTIQKCWPYHAKAYLSSTPPKIVDKTDGLDPCGAKGVVPKGSGNYTKDYFEDTTITDYFKSRYIASAWAATDSAGTKRPSSYVNAKNNVYFKFTGANLILEGNKKYYIYIVRQEDCSSHNGHGNSGFLSALPAMDATKIDYTPEVSFTIKETLNGGTAQNFSGNYGTLDHSFTPNAISGSTPTFKVSVGTTYKLKGVTAKTGYECTGGDTATKTINSDSSHTINFYRKDSIAFYDRFGNVQDTDTIRHGSTLKIRNYTYDVHPCQTFNKWKRGSSADASLFEAGKSYGYSSLIPTGQALGSAVCFYPTFNNKTCTVTYSVNKEYPDAYSSSNKVQRVVYNSDFTVGDLTNFNVDTNNYVFDGWTITGSNGEFLEEVTHKSTVKYDWATESVIATPKILARKYKIVFYSDYTSSPLASENAYGWDIFSKTFRIGCEKALKIPTDKFIRGWRIKDTDIEVSSIADWGTLVAHGVYDAYANNTCIELVALLDDNIKLVVYDSKGDRQRVYIKRYNSATNKWEDLSLQIYNKNNGKWV